MDLDLGGDLVEGIFLERVNRFLAMVEVDGREVGVAKVEEGLRTHNFNIPTKGPKTLELELYNRRFANTTFTQNPTVAAAIITRKVSVAVKVDGKIQTKISKVKNYSKAEEYHQKYIEKNR